MFAIDIKYQDTYCNNRTKPIAAECLDIIVSLLKEQGFGSKQNSICLYAAAHAVDFYIMNYFVDITKYLILDKDVFFFVYNKQE